MKIKICCVSSIEEAHVAINAGASAIGLVSKMPSGPGVISEELIAEIATSVSGLVDTFLLTSESEADEIIQQYLRCKTTTIQICDHVSFETLKTIRQELPDIKTVKVIHVQDEASIEEAESFAPFVDALLLDSGNQKLPIKKLGGTGETHDWSLSEKIVQQVSVPVYLAGGLNAENITRAIDAVKPFGVDICSGVRTHGKLDPVRLFAFIRNVNKYMG